MIKQLFSRDKCHGKACVTLKLMINKKKKKSHGTFHKLYNCNLFVEIGGGNIIKKCVGSMTMNKYDC